MAVDRRTWLKLVTVGAGASVAGSAAASPQGHSSANPSPVVTVVAKGRGKTDYSAALAKLSAYIVLHLKDYGLPGMTFCMADEDGFVATIYAGWADVDKRLPVGPGHLFEIGSISKSFAAICVLKAAAAGKLSLDDAMADHLPGVPLPAEKITVRQVLTHASGLPDDAPFFPRGGDEKLWTGFTPGTHFSYSNTGYALLGLMLERIHKKPYAEIVRTEALVPLGMTGAKGEIRSRDQADYATGYWPFDQRAPFPQRGRLGVAYFTDFTEASGCVAATAGDMAHYVRYLIDAGAGHGAPLLADADARRFTTPLIEAPVFGPKARYALGLGVVPVNGRSLLHHTGGMLSFSSSIHIDPEGGVGAFASTNAAIGDYRPRDVTAYACELMVAARQGTKAPAAPAIKYDDRIDKAADYAGRYTAADGEAFILQAQGTTLTLAYDHDGPPVILRNQGDDAFLVPHHRFADRLLVVKREGGRAASAWRGDIRFVKAPGEPAAARTPPALAALAGLYVNNDPWSGSMRVIAREDGLFIEGVQPLVLLPDRSYRVGDDDKGCERVRFEAPLDGRPQRMIFSGVDHTRMADEI